MFLSPYLKDMLVEEMFSCNTFGFSLFAGASSSLTMGCALGENIDKIVLFILCRTECRSEWGCGNGFGSPRTYDGQGSLSISRVPAKSWLPFDLLAFIRIPTVGTYYLVTGIL